jgi:autotransporter-associated beta strand protein
MAMTRIQRKPTVASTILALAPTGGPGFRSFFRRRLLAGAIAAAFGLIISPPVHAANYTWIGPDNGTWDQTGANWSPAGATWANPAGFSHVAQLGSSNVTVFYGEVFVNSFSGSGSLSATINSTIRLWTGNSSFSGTIGQLLRVVWNGSATLDFSGTNNDTLNQWVFRRNGTLRLSSADAWKTNSYAKVEDSTANLGFTIELAAADESFNMVNLFLNNGITAGNGNFVRFAAIGADRTVTWTGPTPGGAATAIPWNSSNGDNLGDTLGLGNANATHKLIWASGINLNGGSGATLTRKIDVTNGTAAVGGEVSGVISDSGATKATLVKTGSGTLLLSTNNTYAGATTVSNGTLVVGQTNALGTGTATVKTNATLAIASGVTYTRAVTFEAGSVLAGQGTFTTNNWTTPAGLTLKPGLPVGSPTGTLTVAVGGAGNTLTLGANNVLRTVIQPDGVTYGKLTVSGALDISAATARLVVSGPMPTGKIVIAEGTSISGQFQSGNVDLSGLTGPGADKATIYYTSTQVLLGPPPSGTVIWFR